MAKKNFKIIGKKGISFFVACVMAVSVMTTSAFAAELEIQQLPAETEQAESDLGIQLLPMLPEDEEIDSGFLIDSEEIDDGFLIDAETPAPEGPTQLPVIPEVPSQLPVLPETPVEDETGKGNNGQGNDKGNTGVGQEQGHIHLGDDKGLIAENKETFKIIVGDKEYNATLTGSVVTVDFGDKKNGFDFGKDESMVITFISSKGSGTITIVHQEGNGNNIGNEWDEGLNNYKGDNIQIAQPGEPTHPIVPPTEGGEDNTPGVPTHPIIVPPTPIVPPTEGGEDNTPGVPTHPIIVPPTPIDPSNPGGGNEGGTTPPTDIVTPPTDGGNGGSTDTDYDRPNNDDRDDEIVDIDEEDVPLSDLPEEEVPTEEAPELEEIPEDDVPLADIPKTGDPMALYALASAASGAAYLALKRKKDAE